jgi:hypothetical protein
MGKLLDLTEEFFLSEDWKYKHRDGKPGLVINMNGKNAGFTIFAVEAEAQECLTFYALAPNRVPEEKRKDVAEFLTRANYGMRNGNFELDFADGEVRYKTFIDVEGGTLTRRMIQNLFVANLGTMDRYYPGLMKVMFGGATPATAVAGIEGV